MGACLVLAAIALPASAAAKPGYTVLDPSFSLEARLPRSHGYSLKIQSEGHRRIELVVSQGIGSARYEVKGRANRNRLDADFGRFGEISLRFRGKPAPAEEGFLEEIFGPCRGPKTRRQVGTLRGHLRFRGEHGFVEVATRRVHAETTRTFRRVCHPQGAMHGGGGQTVKEVAAPHPHGDRLAPRGRLLHRLRAGSQKSQFRVAQFVARSRAHGRQIALLALQTEPEFLSIVVAGDSKQVGRVKVKRSALTFPEHNPLKLSEPGAKVETALLQGPQPFSGKAEYVKGPGARPTWTGSLRVSLPGEQALALAGPGFHSGLCIAESSKELDRCSKALVQGSGSHSQALADTRLSWSR